MSLMRRWFVIAGLGLTMVPSLLAAGDLPGQVDVFTDNPADVTGIGQLRAQGIVVVVHDTAALTRIEAELSEGLPADEAAAMAMMRARLNAIGEDQIAPLRTAHLARHHQQRLEITRTPAVVFDELAILYDFTDLPMALQQWKEHQP